MTLVQFLIVLSHRHIHANGSLHTFIFRNCSFHFPLYPTEWRKGGNFQYNPMSVFCGFIALSFLWLFELGCQVDTMLVYLMNDLGRLLFCWVSLPFSLYFPPFHTLPNTRDWKPLTSTRTLPLGTVTGGCVVILEALRIHVLETREGRTKPHGICIYCVCVSGCCSS